MAAVCVFCLLNHALIFVCLLAFGAAYTTGAMHQVLVTSLFFSEILCIALVKALLVDFHVGICSSKPHHSFCMLTKLTNDLQVFAGM